MVQLATSGLNKIVNYNSRGTDYSIKFKIQKKHLIKSFQFIVNLIPIIGNLKILIFSIVKY